MTLLLATPQRYPDECMSGYRCRVANDNGFYRWAEFKRACIDLRAGSDREAQSLLKTSTQLLLGVELASDERADDVLRLHCSRRVCPFCLADAPYLRSSWRLALLPRCLIHAVLLVDHCPDCGEPLSNDLASVAHCTCGADLREMRSNVTVVDISWAERLIAAKWGFAGASLISSSTPFAALAAIQLEQLVFLLGAHAAFEKLAKPRKVAIRSDVGKAALVVDVASKLMAEWPEGFYALLDAARTARNNERGIRSHFGYLYLAVYKEFAESEFQFLRDAMDTYIATRWVGFVTQKNRWQSQYLRDQPPYISSTRLSKNLHVSRPVIEHWLLHDELSGSIRILPSERQQVFIAAGQVDAIDQLVHSYNVRKAEKLLGFPKRRIRELLRAGIIMGTQRCAGGVWHITSAALNHFRNQIYAVVIPYQIDQSFVSVEDILRHHMCGEFSFVDLMHALLRGEFACALAAHEISMKSLQIEKQSFHRWLQKLKSGISIPELAKRLAVKQEVAYHLVRHQFIKANDLGRMGQFVSEDAITEFERTYCFGRDIARLMHTSPKCAVGILGKRNIHPVAGPTVDGCRQYLYSRAAPRVLFPQPGDGY